MKVIPALLAEALPATHWPAQDAKTDDEIAQAVADHPDAQPLLAAAQTAAGIARAVRHRLGLTHTGFARRFRVPVGALRDWEQNRRQPDAPALAYLRVVAREPEVVARALEPE